jgi:hypothetical protein
MLGLLKASPPTLSSMPAMLLWWLQCSAVTDGAAHVIEPRMHVTGHAHLADQKQISDMHRLAPLVSMSCAGCRLAKHSVSRFQALADSGWSE